jgi:hypothetical protein
MEGKNFCPKEEKGMKFRPCLEIPKWGKNHCSEIENYFFCGLLDNALK